MNADKHRWRDLTERIIGGAIAVSNHFGCGLLEKPYRNAIVVDLRKDGPAAEVEKRIELYYCGVMVGEYVADIIVENTIIVEVKAVKALDEVHSAQRINYLKATGFPLCLLLNVGRPKLRIKRYIRTTFR